MKQLWAEKYRPKNVDDYIFMSGEIQDTFRGYLGDNNIPNLLLSGTAGVGKSSLARIMINELGVDDVDVLTLNSSIDSGIAVVRDTIDRFCETAPMGDFKIVYLEEADRLTPHSQDALRVVTEENSDDIRFIFTCNDVNKITNALHSRFQSFHIDTLDHDGVVAYIADILESENIPIDDDESVDRVLEHINAYYPDVRKIINSIEQSCQTGKLIGVIGSQNNNDVIDMWRDAWAETPDYDTLMNIAKSIESSNTVPMYVIMYENVHKLPDDRIAFAYVHISEYMTRSYLSANQEIDMCACLTQIFKDV